MVLGTKVPDKDRLFGCPAFVEHQIRVDFPVVLGLFFSRCVSFSGFFLPSSLRLRHHALSNSDAPQSVQLMNATKLFPVLLCPIPAPPAPPEEGCCHPPSRCGVVLSPHLQFQCCLSSCVQAIRAVTPCVRCRGGYREGVWGYWQFPCSLVARLVRRAANHCVEQSRSVSSRANEA